MLTTLDIVFIIALLVLAGISVFCWIYTIISFMRKKDCDSLFPKKIK